VKSALDLSIEIDRRQMAERDRQGGQEFLEAQALGERQLYPLSLQGAGEGLAEGVEPLDQLVRPGAFATNGAEGEHAEDGSPGAQRDRHLRARAHALIARPIDGSLLGKLIDPRESDEFPAPQFGGRPGELIGVHDARRLLEARQRPRDPDPRPACDVFVEIGAVHAQERADLLERELERPVDIGCGDVNQPGRQFREERFEPQALLQKGLRPPGRHAVKPASQSQLSRPGGPGRGFG
jgi:hypothetical protein